MKNDEVNEVKLYSKLDVFEKYNISNKDRLKHDCNHIVKYYSPTTGKYHEAIVDKDNSLLAKEYIFSSADRKPYSDGLFFLTKFSDFVNKNSCKKR